MDTPALPLPPALVKRVRSQPAVARDQNAEAGSSKQPLMTVEEAAAKIARKEQKKRRREQKALAIAAVVPNGVETTTVPNGEPSEAKEARAGRRRRDKGKAKAGDAAGGGGEWQCLPLAQSQVSKIPPIWTRDGRFYVTAENTSIHVHSASPPYARKSTLAASVKPHKAPITALLLSPLSPAHVVSASEDGSVKIWDLESGDVVQTIHVIEGKVLQMCIGQVAGRWEVFVTVCLARAGKKSASYRIFRFPYPTSSSSTPQALIFNKLGAAPTALFISPSSLYLVALAANKAYTFLLPLPGSSPSPDWKAQLVKFVTDQPLTCGTFAPLDKLKPKAEDWFATGDEKGVIRLWHGLGQAFRLLGASGQSKDGAEVEKRLPTTSLHWHAHAVAALAFTPSGSQLLSVGEESVLVQWHLASGKREYIPRLGGKPILSLAIKQAAVKGQEEEWWMAFADGAVQKVGAGSGRIEGVGQGVKIDPLRQTDATTPYPLTLHPSTSALVLPSSNPGTLQFVNPAQTSLLFDLEVAPSNRVSRRDDKHLVPVAVEHVAFSDAVKGQCEWMATVEGRKGDEWEGGGEVRNLKIWRWDGQRYLVNTQFPRPHGITEISSLAFSPLNTPTSPALPYLLSTAIDGTAKLWQVRQSKKSEHGKNASKRPASYDLFWSSRSSWTYRSLPILSASFSPDSTLIALAHGASGVLSLWDTESNVLLRALDAGGSLKCLNHVVFAGESGRWVVGAGQGGVVSWDLLSCEKTTSVSSQNITSLLPLPHSNSFLTAQTISHSTIISIYTPTSSTPLRSVTVPHALRTLLYLPSSRQAQASSAAAGSHLNFAALTLTGDLLRLGDDTSSAPISSTLALAPEEDDKGKGKLSIWQEMFGEQAFLAPTSTSATEAGPSTLPLPDRKAQATGRKGAVAVYDGPSHTLPPAHLLFDGFMQAILDAGSYAAQAVAGEGDGGGEGGDKVLYEMEEEAGAGGLEGRVQEREVGVDEVKELEVFFSGLLAEKSKGKGRAVVNGANGHPEEEEEEEEMEVEVEEPEERPAVVSKVNGSTPRKVNGAARMTEEEEDRVVSHAEQGASGKKGKKRRAPKDLD
ncbi:WD40-repeat-containing domain protein [Dioszegia hungarica]|uniref:WD40-repeat-containing domain protein n=1 Tax=Dioszegia hungarica TaxID=4972 RepID=A0AA38HFG5_9TREE|nr:WD40-repeat-containing domain protein [Dioszegia hungarica]KAI9638599.1 WD40-repeat-containing domain protein [Dioszegia hungarica]